MVEYAYKENGVLKLKPVALSLSQSEIDEIATELLEAMQPDWQNAIDLTVAQLQAGYVCPADGLIVGWSIPANGSSYATVNGVTIARADYVSGVYAAFTNVQCLVNKGDVFKIDHVVDPHGISFVPFKTMNPVSLRPLDPHKIDTAILNHWDDITSDFSTAGSTSGVTLMFAKYNPFLRELRFKCKRKNSTGAGTTINFKLAYNGSQDITFGENTISTMTHFGEGSATILGGPEIGCKVLSGSQIQIDMYNRNGNNAWAANDTFRGIIWL